MPTIQQQKAAKILLGIVSGSDSENKNATQKEILLKAGYSEKSAKQPCRVFESKGMKEILKELKITKEDRLQILGKILHSADKRSAIAANQEISKMLGEYAPIKQEIDDIRTDRREIITPE